MTSEKFGIQLWILLYLVRAAAEDIRKREIDVKTMLFFIAVNLAAITACGMEPLGKWRITGCLPGLLMLAINRFSRGAVGLGDAVVILWVGYAVGVVDCLRLLTIAWSVCFAAAAVYFVLKKKGSIPFLPFLCIGYFINLYMKLVQ